MPVEASVQFVNVDLLIGGRFDRAAILKAVGNGVMALHEEAVIEGKKCLLLEVTDPGLGLSQTLMRLAGWVEQLPPKARRSLSLASTRRFDLGIQAGMRPYETHWIIPATAVAALAKIGADVALTVYGAHRKARPDATSKKLGGGSPRRRRSRPQR